MPNANFSVGQVNITDYLRIFARKVSNPLVIAYEVPPFIPPSTSLNISIPGLEATTYYIDFRESVDGVALGSLLATYVYDVKNDQLVAEMRFYEVDGLRDFDPASEQDTITDAYLDGKNIAAVFKEGLRPLAPPTEDFKEYDLVAGGGIKLLNGLLFSPGEKMVIWISYLVKNPGTDGGGGEFTGRITIAASLTMDSAYYNKRIKCVGAGTRLVVTFAALSSVPDNTVFYFTTNTGTQLQTKFVTQGGELFEHAMEDVQELTLGKGEYLKIVKYGNRYEVDQVHPNVLRIGHRFAGKWKDHLNTMPEDDRLLDGDDYPRIWYFIKNKLPITHVLVTTNALIAALARPVGKENLFIICSDSKKFRMPNAQNWSERGLKDFDNYNTDAARDYDYPGGTQKEMVGPHIHPVKPPDSGSYTGYHKTTTGGEGPEGTGIDEYNTLENDGTEQRVKNFGIIYLSCI